MKLLPLCALALPFAPGLLAETPLPNFAANIVGYPPLSLKEATNAAPKVPRFGANLPSFADPAPAPETFGLLPKRATRAQIQPPQSNFTVKSAPGQMPVIEPNPEIDYKIALAEPKSGTDFKLLVVPPAASK